MKILITIPSTAIPHGGIRVILEWANRLTQWHDVYLYNLSGRAGCHWFDISKSVKPGSVSDIWQADCIILTSPHSAHLLDMILPGQKCFLFLQMMEDMFNPTDMNWLKACNKFYQSPYPMFTISSWNYRVLSSKFGRRATIPVINGINLDQFPISTEGKEQGCVLVEGWQSTNPTKDTDKITHRVAEWLKRDGYTILAYGSDRVLTSHRHLHQYFRMPTLNQLNRIYERASVLIKATRYDARSCSPVEAMTKGTVTARAIIEGDDDLTDGVNCLRCGYDADELYEIAKKLLTDDSIRSELSANCIEYAKSISWENVMPEINDTICKG